MLPPPVHPGLRPAAQDEGVDEDGEDDEDEEVEGLPGAPYRGFGRCFKCSKYSLSSPPHSTTLTSSFS